MGLYDRDYYRRASQGSFSQRAGGRLRLISVNTWLIILCVGVFFVDNVFLAKVHRWVRTGQVYMVSNPTTESLDLSRQSYGPVVGPNRIDPNVLRYYAERHGSVMPNLRMALILDRPPEERGAQVVGYAEVREARFIESYLSFSTGDMIYRLEYWRLIGFQFLHANIGHLFFNMLGLFFFGPMVEQYLGSKRYLAFYLLCGIAGAVLYLILNVAGIVATDVLGVTVQVPLLLFNDVSTPLVGASAGIFGVLMAGAYLEPNAIAYLMFFPMRLATLAWVLIGIALLTVFMNGENAGGQAAHLGGALAGWFFIRRSHMLHGFFDILGRADPTSRHYRAKRASRRQAMMSPARQSEIDKVLDKISTSGIHSLTEEEKRLLADDTERRRGP